MNTTSGHPSAAISTVNFYGADLTPPRRYMHPGAKRTKTWQKTRLQNLVRHKSGRYYARAFAHGKEVWKSLGTSHFGVAESKLAEFLQDHRMRRSSGASLADAKLTFGAALQIHRQALKDNRNIKPATVHYWEQIFASLLRSWPDLNCRELRRITSSECAEWAARFSKKASPTRFNNTLAALRHVFGVAMHAGILYRDPSAKLQRIRIRSKQLTLPSRKEFIELVRQIENAHGRFSRACSEFVRGLAYTGMRKSEAAELRWHDLLFDVDEIVVRGDPETGTKNWDVRRVPMIPEARELFARMRSLRGHEKSIARVFRVRESQKAIDSACKKVGIHRFVHHDLRHLFATTCIESGVDIPTVSRFLGHRDGGALAMKTYGHLRREHSAEQAKRVRFSVL